MNIEPDFTWQNLPLKGHRGLIISKGVIQRLSIDEIKYKYLSVNLDTGFEKIQEKTEIKFLEKYVDDSLWLIRWEQDDEKQIALILGSEF